MCTLLTTTRQLLADRPRTKTYAIIEQDLGLRETWLMDFASGRIRDPGVQRVQKLYEYLSGRKLAL